MRDGDRMIDSLAPPLDEARAHWLDLLGEARLLVGPHFVHGPPIVGDEVCFPDTFGVTRMGATRLLRRMLAHATRSTSATAVADFGAVQHETSSPKSTDGERTSWRGPASQLSINDGDVFLELEAELAALPDALLDEIAFAVTRWWLWQRGVEPAHDLIVATGVALGFGPLLLQGTWVVEQGGETRGHFTTSWQRVSSSRRATPGELAFLVAHWARARGITTAKALGTAHLRDNQLGALKAAFAAPADARFAGPVVATWPLTDGRIAVDDLDDLEDLDDAEADGQATSGDEGDDVDLAAPVFRVIDRRFAGPVALSVVTTVPLGIAMVFVHRHLFEVSGTFAAIATLVWLGAGMVQGWRNAVDICSDPTCRSEIGPLAQHCPGCGRVLGGRIASADDRLRAEEEWQAARLAPLPSTSAGLFSVSRR